MKRRHYSCVLFVVAALVLSGCSSWNDQTVRSQSPEEPAVEEPTTRLVGDLAVPTGMNPVRIEAVSIVTGLHGTGSAPSPSPQRDALLEEMQKRGVENPDRVLESGDVALVLVQAWLRPGLQKGDHFDVEVRVPSLSETRSLRGGYLLETRLSEAAVLGGRVHTGNLLALAKGPVMVDPAADPKKDRVLACRGRVLGAGVALQTRPLGLVLTPGNESVMNSSRIANAIDRRFHMFQNGRKIGVAKAKTDNLIELTVHPRYKDNIARYVQVVRAVAISETDPERMERIATLRTQLLDPETAAGAAMQLEAIGVDGADALLKGIASDNPEVRFYAAEALAYLDRREAAEPLGQIARDQPAFRVFALTALSAMQEYAAYEQLRDLLASPSAETRYGAFRALWTMNSLDPVIKGEVMGGQFNYHVLDVAGPPMIHVTRNRLSELVVFGPGQRLTTPLAVNAGNEIMVTSSGGDEIVLSKFTVREGDQKRTVSTRVDDVVRAIVELGGTYPDVVQALQEAKTSGALASRFEVDALPEAGRAYDRVAKGDEVSDESEGDAETAGRSPASPSPELFSKRGVSSAGGNGAADAKSAKKQAEDDDSDEKTPPKKGFLARMFGSK